MAGIEGLLLWGDHSKYETRSWHFFKHSSLDRGLHALEFHSMFIIAVFLLSLGTLFKPMSRSLDLFWISIVKHLKTTTT